MRYLLGESTARLGGAWLSLLAINVGSALVWASIFVIPLRGGLHSAAYLFYVLSMLPIAWQVGRALHGWFRTLEEGGAVQMGD